MVARFLRPRCALPSLCALLAGSAALACVEPPLSPREPTPGAPHFTVMSYNVELYSADEPTTIEAIGAADADVLALQEVTHATEAILKERYAEAYPHQLYYSAGGTDGLAMLSRFPLVDLGLRPGPGSWHPAWHVDVEVPGVRLQVLNVHLRSLLSGSSGALQSYLSTEDDHVREIADFTGACEDGASNLVVGDFNEGPDGKAVAYLERLGFANALPSFRPGQPTWRFRSVGGQLESTIDHILYDGSLAALDSWVEVRGRSDHLPVLAHFERVTF